MIIPVYVDNQFDKSDPEPMHLIPSNVFEELWSSTPKTQWGTCRMSDYLLPDCVDNVSPFVIQYVDNYFYYKAGRISFAENPTNGCFIRFNEGRHRTRWLLDNNCKYIPIGIRGSLRSKVLEAYNLTDSLVKPGSHIDLPFTKESVIKLHKSQLNETLE